MTAVWDAADQMSAGKRRLLVLLFVVGGAFYAFAFAAGVWYSVRTHRSMPGISLDYIGTIKDQLTKGEYELALPQAEMALALDHATEHIAHQVMGALLARQDKTDEAIHHFREALAFQPRYSDGHFGLAMALAKKGEDAMAMGLAADAATRLAEAIGHFQKTLELQREHPTAPKYLEQAFSLLGDALKAEGRALSGAGQHLQAVAKYRQALRIKPDDAETCNHLAEILATHPNPQIRNGRAALQYAEKARQLTSGQHPVALQTLAAALAEVGQFAEAVKTAQQAMQLLASSPAGREGLANRIQVQLELYRKQQPFRRPDWARSQGS